MKISSIQVRNNKHFNYESMSAYFFFQIVNFLRVKINNTTQNIHAAGDGKRAKKKKVAEK